MMMQNGSVERIGRPPSWICKINVLTTSAHERHTLLRHHAVFSAGRSHCCRGITIFRVFLVKCKNSPDDRAYYMA